MSWASVTLRRLTGKLFQKEVVERVRVVSRILSGHAGGIELAALSPDGVATIRFLGACAGCPLRPVTLACTIRPAMEGLEGVRTVDAVGVRLSDEASKRVSLYAQASSRLLVDAALATEASWIPASELGAGN